MNLEMMNISKIWNWFVGKPLTPQQILRKNQRLIRKAMRGVEREIYNLGKQEEKQVQEIKRMAQKNQPEIVRALANDLVRLRSHMKKLLKMKQNLQGISIQLQTLETHQSISQAVYQATIALRGMNAQLNLPRVKIILKEFEKQNHIMEIKDEMINDTMDDVTGVEEDGEESDDIVAQVLDELGLQIGQALPETPHDPKSKTGAKATIVVGAKGSESKVSQTDELLARLENLRKN